MRIIFLGTGGYHPCERRHTAGVLLPDISLLLDAGTGTFRLPALLQRREVTLALTHAHLDHVCGLTYLLPPLHDGRIEKLRVLADAGVLEALRSHLFAPALFPVVPPAEFEPLLEDRPVTVAPGVQLAHRRLPGHPGGSRAFRVDWHSSGEPRSIAYVTDTIVDGTYSDFIRGVDLLIHECNFPDRDSALATRTGHSHATPVAKLALSAGVRQLVLTHLDPQSRDVDPVGLDAMRRIFASTSLAEDLQQLDV